MHDTALLDIFIKFGLAGLLGFLIGLEREMKGGAQSSNIGLRDFVLYGLLGAVSAFLAQRFQTYWFVIAGFFSQVALILSGFWADSHSGRERDLGITTEVAAFLTFLLGVLVFQDAATVAIALAIVMLAVLSRKDTLHSFRSHLRAYELQAAVKLLVISFIVLPVLPDQPLSGLLSFPLGTVAETEPAARQLTVDLEPGQAFHRGEIVELFDESGRLTGTLEIAESSRYRVRGRMLEGEPDRLSPGAHVRGGLGVRPLSVMLAAINPYRLWLIVVLVSFVSFVGYVLVKSLGGTVGVGLTGLVGGLASSTVTTLSFARRSRERPSWNRQFAGAVILASSIMFPRLLLQIGLVNRALMERMALPLIACGLTGLAVALRFVLASRSGEEETNELQLENPFSLASALKFALVFAVTLMVSRLAIAHLGNRWLPPVAVLSGLTDSDAIAFSVSDAEQAGLITLEWASFNAVLGALANTLMKLILVLLLGHRGLFKQLLIPFLLIIAAGTLVLICRYDPSAMVAAAGG